MQTANAISNYYHRIIGLILDLYHDDFSSASSGHCMKISGLGLAELEYLWDQVQERYPTIETYIISEENASREKFITAAKLIELRNRQTAPLLVLIPSNSRTAAEDSYGNATFKEIPFNVLNKN